MNNITLGKYIELNESERLQYDVLLNSLKPKNKFLDNEIDFNTITYAEVRKLFKLAKNDNSNDLNAMRELFKLAYHVTDIEFNNALITEAFSAKNYIVKFLNDTQANEAKLLKSIDVNEGYWQSAGGDRLNVFSDVLPLMQLGEIYGIYPMDMQTKPYAEILLLLVANKTKREVDNKYNELKSKAK